MDIVFEINDRRGKKIFLTNKQEKHIITRHSDVKLENVRETIIDPLIIKKDKLDDDLNYYYKYDKIKKEYLLVVVKYLNGKGFILTSFYIKNIRK
ncbi:hypothetical protein CL617_03315 [archaeon]|nr:hypothetical protein [archaeon]|tara:strand:- start:5259 stop:5543 length:285 start_codon:yes stop_codon:yes gene_type:complete